ncbi:hypothetical protein KR009_009775, partial [Drosophila setifemur]
HDHEGHHHGGHDAGSNPKHTDGHEGHGGGGGGHDMSMVFHTGYTEAILFNFWRTQSAFEIVLSCFIVFLMAVFYEALKVFREWILLRKKKRLAGGRDQYPPRRDSYNYNNHHFHNNQNQNQNQSQNIYNNNGYQQPTNPPPSQTQFFVYRPRTPSLPPVPPGQTAPSGGASNSQSFYRPAPSPQHSYHPSNPHIQPDAVPPPRVPINKVYFSCMHLVQTLLHVLQVFVSFLLMLIFMTFNVWLCLAILLGAGVGYFIFGAFSTTIQEHCN